MTKKGQSGIGRLVLFIAMILVAAIAAGVLIQTSSTLQSKAMATGSQSQDQVSTSAQFVSIYATGADGNNDVEEYFLETKLSPASEIIKLEDTVLEWQVSNQSSSLSYSSGDCDTLSKTEYHVEYLINGTSHIDGYLSSGDVIKLCFEGERSVSEDENVVFTLIPRTGGLTRAQVTTPMVMTDSTVYLYP